MRFFFGTDRSAYLNGTYNPTFNELGAPEAGSFALMGFGLIGLSALSRLRRQR